MAKAGFDKGLKLLGITEHAPGIPGTVDPFYYLNLEVIPRTIYGVEVLHGSEINVLNLSVWSMLHAFISVAPWFLFFVAIEHLGKTELAISKYHPKRIGNLFRNCQLLCRHYGFIGEQCYWSRREKRTFPDLPQGSEIGICCWHPIRSSSFALQPLDCQFLHR